MADRNAVCCMCGDIGFPDKLFRCGRCFSRVQHSYCSSYREESPEASGLCEWCRSEERKSSRNKHPGAAHARKPPAVKDHGAISASHPDGPTTGERAAKLREGGDRQEEVAGGRGKSAPSGAGPSARPTGRRYKLLKDVLC